MGEEFVVESDLSLCGNCCKEIDNEVTVTSIKINGFDDIFTDQVGITDAMSYIYGISWVEFLAYSEMLLKNHSDIIPVYSKNKESVHLCESCNILLSDSYVARRRFENKSHPSSVVQQINSFREQHQLAYVQKYEISENYSPSDYDEPEEDFVESFNFEDKYKVVEDQAEEVSIEEKYVPEDDETTEKFTESEQTLTTRNSLKLRQLVIKLERLPIDNIKIKSLKTKFPCVKKKGGSRARNNFGEKVVKTKVTRNYSKSLQRKGKYQCTKINHLPLHYGKDFSKTCEVCGKVIKRVHMKRHMDVFHGDEKSKLKWRYPCKICGKDYSTPLSVRLHMSREHSSVPRESYKCVTCGKEYLSKPCYDDHILIHAENFTPYMCVQCGKTFETKLYLGQHEKSHTSGNRKILPCDICSKKFQNKSERERHRQCHSTERKFVCDECGKTYKFKNHLVEHLRMHAEIAEKGENNSICDECGKVFKNASTLRKHKKCFHGDESKKKVYTCSFCGKQLTNSWNLKVHENSVHRNNRLDGKEQM